MQNFIYGLYSLENTFSTTKPYLIESNINIKKNKHESLHINIKKNKNVKILV